MDEDFVFIEILSTFAKILRHLVDGQMDRKSSFTSKVFTFRLRPHHNVDNNI